MKNYKEVIGVLQENLSIPIYYAIIKKRVVIDEESIREYFEQRLKEVIKETQ